MLWVLVRRSNCQYKVSESGVAAELNASLSWADETGMAVRQGLPPEPSWRAFAAFLLCGKIYE